ncbi:NAD-dependent deacylase [Sphingobacterium sp. SRCM116780]|uniref:Sir2 family NAD-dependent protein deacetylase n=1 Tax=Sphingobacterium sp. SRCM116780 TaxID=2907623 RepID=UPI001F26666C|nr:Sir2 family NAD-dependent protein deacetylase [Sphingobacterium sp. SRCM116780]UIR57516.1 NAD-dependent deacylase [Sphingobacterium sp. SRCM116780]
MKKKIVVFTGAGISAESGIQTFRDANGLWEGHHVEDVASIDGWNKNPSLVQNFYNMRRQIALNAEPNAAHCALVTLEKVFDVHIITQNVDLLHERSGSSHVLHLHGRLDLACSSLDKRLIYPVVGHEIKMGDCCEKGSQLRPNIVWFGESVPNMEPAIQLSEQADIMIVTGTSLTVYPAASLVEVIVPTCDLYVIDKHINLARIPKKSITMEGTASEMVPKLVNQLIAHNTIL